MYPRQDLGDFVEETGEVPSGTGEYRIGVGDVLDNLQAGGVDVDALLHGEQDFVVIFERDTGGERPRRNAINLANVVALARIGAQSLLDV